MKRYRYFTIFLLTITAFLALPLLLSNASPELFILELYFMLLLLIISGIALVAIGRDIGLGWALYTLLFLTFLFNAVFLYITAAAGKIVFYIALLAGAIGFLVSVYNTGSCKRRRMRKHIAEAYEPYKSEVEPEVQPEIEPFKRETAKPAAKPIRKKRTAKKKTKKTKKSAKKKAKKARKKVNRSSAKKAA